MSNFSLLGCLELLLLFLTLFRVKIGGVFVDPNFFLHISFSWVEISLHVEFHLLGLPRSGRSMVGDKKKQKKQQHFHRFNGFLSLQFKLRMGLGLRLTNRCFLEIDLISASASVLYLWGFCWSQDVQWKTTRLLPGSPRFVSTVPSCGSS